MVFWFGFRHLSDDTIGGFSIMLHASAYSVLPSIAGGLSLSITVNKKLPELLVADFHTCHLVMH